MTHTKVSDPRHIEEMALLGDPIAEAALVDWDEAGPPLLEALRLAELHLEWCGWGDKYERECARGEGLPAKIAEAIAKAETALHNKE